MERTCVEPSDPLDSDMLKRPHRIILVRHGESRGNVDESLYSHVADSKISLTENGRTQARKCGEKILDLINSNCNEETSMVYFYVSPYRRTLQTVREIARSIPECKMAGIREEPRIREQDFGNFQNAEVMKAVKMDRERFGKFFFRFPEGESSADVYDRVSGFLDSLWRDIIRCRIAQTPTSFKSTSNLNIVIVTHGLTMRVLLTRWFKWTTREFEQTRNPGNCELRVLEQGMGGEYSLAVQHTASEMIAWGLSQSIIKDQFFRKSAVKGDWVKKPFSSDEYFAEIDLEDEESPKENGAGACSATDSIFELDTNHCSLY